MKTSQRLERIPEYIHARLLRAAADVERTSGRKVLSFGAGNPDVPPSEKYIQKFFEFARDPKAHLYPGYRGIPEFNDAVRTWYKKRFDIVLEDDEILPLLGGKDGISHLPLTLADADDEVLVPNPGYPPFSEPNLLFDVKSVFYDLLPERGFKPSLEELEQKISKQTRSMWLNFPSNPTGAVATRDELRPIATLAKERGVLIVYDNAYSEIAFDGFVSPSILQIPGAKEYAVEIGSFSKTFSFAGFRMGWIVGNRNIIAALGKVKSQMDSGMWLPLQKLGAYALTNRDQAWHDAMIESYRERRDRIAEKLTRLGLRFSIPRGGLYLWAEIPDGEEDSETFCMKLLREKQILFTPGSAFGTNGARHIRASICVNITDIDNYL